MSDDGRRHWDVGGLLTFLVTCLWYGVGLFAIVMVVWALITGHAPIPSPDY